MSGDLLRYDLLLKGGHVLDPGQGLDAHLDIAVSGGKIAAIAPDIPAQDAARVLELRGAGRHVVPGLIDLHKAMLECIDTHNPEDKAKDVLTVDGVQMNDTGNEFLAKQFYPYIK